MAPVGKIKSTVFDMDFEVKTFESVEDGNTVNIITHEALEDIIHNQLPEKVGIRYDFTVVSALEAHSVVQCVMSSAEPKRRIVAVGEAVPATLETAISQQYPTTMAWNRAFDRAAIKFLGFEGKVLSNLEAPAYNGAEDGTTNVDLSDDNTPKAAEAAQEAQSGKKQAAPAPAPTGEKKAAQGTRTPPAASQRTNASAQKPANAEAIAAAGATVLDFGKFRGKKMTFEQVAATEDGPGYIRWMVERATGLPANLKQAAEVYHAYLGGK